MNSPKDRYAGRLGVVSALCIFTGSVLTVNAQMDMAALLAREGYGLSTVGVLISRIDTDSIVEQYNADTFFIPASVTKCLTGAAAIELLGQDYVFITSVFMDGPFDPDSGILDGNLYIKGGGDPGFLAERIWLFVEHLYHRGLRKISGDIILDPSFFDTSIVGPGYDEETSSRAYQAPVGALSASFNTIAVHVRPGGRVGVPVHVDVFPKVKGLTIVAPAKTTAPGSISGIEVMTEKQEGKTCLHVKGGMALGAKPKYVYRKAFETWEHFGRVISAGFDDAGIVSRGSVRQATVPDSIMTNTPFYVFNSLPLEEFIRNMFKYSSNFAADMVFKTIAAEYRNGFNGSWDTATAVVSQWWKQRGLHGELQINNGSGMGYYNRLSARQIVSLLSYVWRQKRYFPDYCSALSNAGIDGTLQDRFKNSPLKGIVRAKTGTLNDRGVSTLAGYLFFPKNTYVFAILVNNTVKGQFHHWVLQQTILEQVLKTDLAKAGK